MIPRPRTVILNVSINVIAIKEIDKVLGEIQMDDRLNALLHQLSEKDFITVDTLAAKNNLSEKTTRNLVNQLTQLLEPHGCQIEKKYGKGVRLSVSDRTKFDDFCRTGQKALVPGTSKQRVRYLLMRFLTAPGYIKVEQLCEELFVSRKTMSSELKGVREAIEPYRLKQEIRPRYGVRVTGREFDIRQCRGSLADSAEDPVLFKAVAAFRDRAVIENCLEDSLKRQGYAVYKSSLPNLVFQIHTALYRFESGWVMEMEEADQNSFLQEKDIMTAQDIAHGLQERFLLVLPVAEIKYLAVQLSGKK